MVDDPEISVPARWAESVRTVRRMGLRAGRRLCEDGVPTNNRFLGHPHSADLAAHYDRCVLAAIHCYRLQHPRTKIDLDADLRVAELARHEAQAWLDGVLARAQEFARERARQNPWTRRSE